MSKICDVVICGPAVGKTYLSKNDSRFIDLDELKAKYKYGIVSDENFEENKLNRGKIVHEDSFEYAINILNETIKTDKIVLMSFNKQIIEYLINNKIDYCLVYTDINLRDEYINRMKNRGNSNEFIERMTNIDDWKKFYIENSSDPNPKYKIKLGKNQYLSDIKEELYSR